MDRQRQGDRSRVVFLRTDRLGETVLNLPAVAALRAAWPHASVTFVGRGELAPLVEQAPGVDRVLVYDEARPRSWIVRALLLAGRLRRESFDVAIVSNPKKELHLATWLAGIPCRIGYDHKWSWSLTRRIPDRKGLGERHEVEYNVALLAALGLPVTVPSWRLPLFPKEDAEVSQLLKQHGVAASVPVVAVHPWASNPVKQWPLDRFNTLLGLLSVRRAVVTAVIGGPEETDQAQKFLGSARPGIMNFVGQLSLRQLAAFLRQAAVLVSNDSGPVHVAAAVGTSTVVLFGVPSEAVGPRRWGPWGEGHTVLSKPSLADIQVDEVMEAIQQKLGKADLCDT